MEEKKVPKPTTPAELVAYLLVFIVLVLLMIPVALIAVVFAVIFLPFAIMNLLVTILGGRSLFTFSEPENNSDEPGQVN